MITKRLAVTSPLICVLALAPALVIAPAADAKTVTISRSVQDGDEDEKDPNGKFVLKVKLNGQGVPLKVASMKAVNLNVICLDAVALESVPAGERTVKNKGMKLNLTHSGPKTYYSTKDRIKFTTPDGWQFEIDAAVDVKANKVIGGAIYGVGTDDQGRSCHAGAYIKDGY